MLYFTIQNCLQDGTSQVPEAAGARWRFYRRIIVGYPRIVFLLAEAFREYPLKSWASRFRGRRSIWWGWRVTLFAPRIGNEVSYVTQIIDDIHFAWQVQYLVRLEGDLTCSTHWKWGFICRSLMTFILRGRCSIWWGWRVTWLAPRIGNEVSYVTQIIDDIHFAWQAQYLVRLEGDLTCCTHRKWDFICDADHWWHSFCVAGAVFGEVGGWLYWLHALEMRFHMWRIESKSWHHSHATAKASFKPQKKVWTAQWSVILRTFYRQILSWLYGSFFFWNFRHRLARELLVHVFFMSSCMFLCFSSCVSQMVSLGLSKTKPGIREWNVVLSNSWSKSVMWSERHGREGRETVVAATNTA